MASIARYGACRMRAAIGMAIFWSAVALVGITPLLVVIITHDPYWYLNVVFWMFVGIPAVCALLLGPAWYYARWRLLREEGLTASGQASERHSSAPE